MSLAESISRREAIQVLAAGATGGWAAARLEAADERGAKPARAIVRDRLWVWSHAAGVYNGAWGLPGPSRITPVEGARLLGLANVIFIRYGGQPAPPFDEYAAPFRSLPRVYWSIAGAGGETSQEEREQVFRLAERMPNLVGVFMDDFFHFSTETRPQWLAANGPSFPVTLTLHLSNPVALTKLELVQSDWRTGDYRSAEFAVDLPDSADAWREAGRGALPNAPEACASAPLPGQAVAAVRIRILGTHDTQAALSCGLRRVRAWAGQQEVALDTARIEANSTYAGFDPQVLVKPSVEDARPAEAALSVVQLQAVRQRLRIGERRLDLAVTLYTHQLSPRIVPHLELCDVVSFWTWHARDLQHLEANFAKLRQLTPTKRVLLGCYLWDFGTHQPLPLALMQTQVELGLRWLRAGDVEGLIFLGTNVCDLGLETVAWTQRWIREVGEQSL